MFAASKLFDFQLDNLIVVKIGGLRNVWNLQNF